MPIQVLINLVIAVIWMLLSDDLSVFSFLYGYLFGLVVLFVLRRYFSSQYYPFTFAAIIQLFFVFLYELFVSSLFVIKNILKPKMTVTPGIFRLTTDLKGDVEITLLALLICLTPGSVVVEISPESRVFYIHGMDLPEAIEMTEKSKRKFEKAIKKVTRNW